jgi:hypothetical protein
MSQAGEDECPSPNRKNSPFLYLFVLFKPLMHGIMSTPTGEDRSSLLNLMTQMLAPPRNTLTDIIRNSVFTSYLGIG